MPNMCPGKQDDIRNPKDGALMKDYVLSGILHCAVFYNTQLSEKIQFSFCIA